MTPTITAAAARRIALAAQGFGAPRPTGDIARRQLLSTIGRLGVVQIDSVNVVSRTHYLPAFSRLGAYPRALLEEVAWGRKPALFEYWAHEASLLPLATQPLLRWRMQPPLWARSAISASASSEPRSRTAKSRPRPRLRQRPPQAATQPPRRSLCCSVHARRLTRFPAVARVTLVRSSTLELPLPLQ